MDHLLPDPLSVSLSWISVCVDCMEWLASFSSLKVTFQFGGYFTVSPPPANKKLSFPPIDTLYLHIILSPPFPTLL